jgi:hypothetical protein
MSLETSYFGKYQKIITYAAIIGYQMLGVPLATLCFYALLFKNIPLMIVLLGISFFQFPFKKSLTFIRLVKKYIIPTSYFKKFTRIT